jgi:hypothetical protein
MDLLEAALTYCAWGWSIIPMRVDERKKPVVKWKPYQKQRATEDQLRGWFGCKEPFGLAVVFGEVSGNLASRDFDDMGAYNCWAQQFPVLAATLPTAETRRGRHVYFRTFPDDVARYRASIGKTGHGAIAYPDGELRIGTGCYSVVPPTRHPTGFVYRWQLPLSGELPILALSETGFLGSDNATETAERNRESGVRGENGADRGQRRTTETTEAVNSKVWNPPVNGTVVSGALCCTDHIAQQIERAIIETLPKQLGRRNKQVFEFARALKAISSITDAKANDLKAIVRRWHVLAKPVIKTQAFEETWIDFLRAWRPGAIKYAKGTEPMSQMMDAAVASEAPDVARDYDEAKCRLLVALCRELQRAVGTAPFYLSARKAGRLLDVDHTTAWRWLYLLENDGILEVVTRGSKQTQKASRYRYLGDL